MLSLKIFWTFFSLSLVSVGGVFGVLPELERILVLQNQWITHEQFMQAYALAQFVPGPNMAMCPLIGYWIDGWSGWLAGFAGIYSGPILIMTVGYKCFNRFKKISYVRRAEYALRPLVAGTLAGSGLHFWLSQTADARWLGLALSLLAVGVYYRLRWNAMLVTFGFGAIWWLSLQVLFT